MTDYKISEAQLSGFSQNAGRDYNSIPEPMHFVGIRYTSKGWSTHTQFFVRGNQKSAALDRVKQFIRENEDRIPNALESKILNSESPTIKWHIGSGMLEVGWCDIKRLAEISDKGWLDEAPTVDEKGRKILTREQLIKVFPRAVANAYLGSLHSCFSSPANIIQPPTEEKLAEMVTSAGRVYDLYAAIPKGSMIVTKDFIFPYNIGRKDSDNFIWGGFNHCGYTNHGARIPTKDPSFSFTGVDKSHASDNGKSPVLRVHFFETFDVVEDTFVVPKESEREYVTDAMNAKGKFNAVWVQCAPWNIDKNSIAKIKHGDWYPEKEDLLKGLCDYLQIK